MRRSPFRHMMLGACLVAPFLLAGCSGGDEGVPQTFPPLRYTYLAPISLNVAQIVTVVQSVSSTVGSVDGMSPEAPLDATRQMIQDRLVAAGGGGVATVTINTASLTQAGDTVTGNLSIHLAVRSGDGLRSGYTDATVSRSNTTPEDTSPAAMRAFLYQMTQELVSAENVELEYQIRQNLGSWLVGGGSSVIGGPAAPTPVQAQDLGSPGSGPVPLTGGGAPTVLTPAPLTPAPMPMLVPPSQLPPPPSAPAMSMPMPAVAPAVVAPEPPTVEMPSGSLGMPQGNPVPADVAPPPPPPPVVAPAPIAAPAAPAANNGALPPLPAGITP